MLSDRDPLPTVILEAMSMKNIVIARNVDGVNEIILDQINGFVVDYNFKNRNVINIDWTSNEFKWRR